ncbi:MAG: hypothetical protein ACM3WV_01365 [Bacillota bacterium]
MSFRILLLLFGIFCCSAAVIFIKATGVEPRIWHLWACVLNTKIGRILATGVLIASPTLPGSYAAISSAPTGLPEKAWWTGTGRNLFNLHMSLTQTANIICSTADIAQVWIATVKIPAYRMQHPPHSCSKEAAYE